MSKKSADPVTEEAPGLGDTNVLFLPSPDAVPVAASVSMKLPIGLHMSGKIYIKTSLLMRDRNLQSVNLLIKLQCNESKIIKSFIFAK